MSPRLILYHFLLPLSIFLFKKQNIKTVTDWEDASARLSRRVPRFYCEKVRMVIQPCKQVGGFQQAQPRIILDHFYLPAVEFICHELVQLTLAIFPGAAASSCIVSLFWWCKVVLDTLLGRRIFRPTDISILSIYPVNDKSMKQDGLESVVIKSSGY